MTIKTKYIPLPYSEIFRSVPQMLNCHLPGGVRSYGNYYYLLKTVNNSDKYDADILNIIYDDLIHNLFKWIELGLSGEKEKYDNKKTVLLNQFFSLHSTQKKKIDILTFEEKTLKETEGFKKEYIFNGMKKTDFLVSQIGIIDENKSHVGEYFPHTFKCANCSKLVYSEGYPKQNCCNGKKWVQLSLCFVSPDGKVDSIGRISGDKKDFYEFKCNQPSCKGHLIIKEATQAKNYKIFCSANNKHNNSHHLKKLGFMLYSVFNSGMFYVHTSEVINFDLSFLKQDTSMSNETFIEVCESNINNLTQDSLGFYQDFKNNYIERCKNAVIKQHPELFQKYFENKSIHLDLNNPKINDFCHQQLTGKIQTKTNEFPMQDFINFSTIGLIDNIEVINYSYGFSRISEKPIFTAQGPVKLNFFYANANESINNCSYYASDDNKKNKKQIFYSKEINKGIYFKISEEKIQQLIRKAINKNEFLNQEYIYQNEDYKTIFTYLHSLAHFFIKTISQHFSGINTASLSEMIFPHEFAFVIYKTGISKDLGYLESFFDTYIVGNNLDFFTHINDATNFVCPAFDLCNDGACIECLYVNKHSCKYNNDMLDRNLILK